jgi:hypothetical protein
MKETVVISLHNIPVHATSPCYPGWIYTHPHSQTIIHKDLFFGKITAFHCASDWEHYSVEIVLGGLLLFQSSICKKFNLFF